MQIQYRAFELGPLYIASTFLFAPSRVDRVSRYLRDNYVAFPLPHQNGIDSLSMLTFTLWGMMSAYNCNRVSQFRLLCNAHADIAIVPHGISCR